MVPHKNLLTSQHWCYFRPKKKGEKGEGKRNINQRCRCAIAYSFSGREEKKNRKNWLGFKTAEGKGITLSCSLQCGAPELPEEKKKKRGGGKRGPGAGKSTFCSLMRRGKRRGLDAMGFALAASSWLRLMREERGACWRRACQKLKETRSGLRRGKGGRK